MWEQQACLVMVHKSKGNNYMPKQNKTEHTGFDYVGMNMTTKLAPRMKRRVKCGRIGHLTSVADLDSLSVQQSKVHAVEMKPKQHQHAKWNKWKQISSVGLCD